MRKHLLLLSILLTSTSSFASDALPSVYIDQGACPHECCTYRKWDVLRDTELFDSINGKKITGKAIKGSQVTALTGEVHTVPLKVKDREGQEVYLLTYQGEGNWKIWKKGEVLSDVPQNWQDERKPKSEWWVQIKLANGDTGWAKQFQNFEDPVGCEEAPASAEFGACQLSVTGIEDAKALRQFLTNLKKAAQSQDRVVLGRSVLFPLKVNGEKRFVVKELSELNRQFDSIFTKGVLNAIAKQELTEIFCRDQGVMIGSGQVWITEKKKQIGIFSINPQ